MGICAGHCHEIKGLEDSVGKLGLYHPQDHPEEDLGKRALDTELSPLMSAFLVKMHSHHGHEPGEPAMNVATGYISLEKKMLPHGGEAYAQT